ncbi:glutamate cyclase domain-containing protein [Aquisalinus flavus]|uniref:D-glutamate cyclase-like C-terminal domain-containing protein n=1 Tax=Aquisalinus flavus TaxID=1526572 RepID=A0A8J2V648_9PROT|nr:glutamate cyclase domain-containing protein [Aquisalinus flavus]MBD0426313.1 DUF4392 domain-containing protein [Aquisalinus flavus]UNE48119.1 DUF4392 domain-containing protein [Aquisalinus flavus]GGD08945.1 hypothetical protein GCM10011342_17230 [Aquisalinus flavus]
MSQTRPKADLPAGAVKTRRGLTRRDRLRLFREGARGLIVDGASRGIGNIRTPASFSLHRLAEDLAGNGVEPCIGILTGFPILLPDGTVQFENDGPIGAGMLAGAFAALGWKSVIISDHMAGRIVDAIIDGAAQNSGAGIGKILLDENCNHGTVYGRGIRSRLQTLGITHLIAIERPGKARDGEYYNMRAEQISSHIIAADALFRNCPWKTAGFADGGNEIGMGKVGIDRIAHYVDKGSTIVSRTKVDYLTLCGVSNWGAYGLLAGLAVALPDRRDLLFQFLSAQTNRKLFAACKDAGAVDGVTRRQTSTVDNIPLADHDAKIGAFRALADRLTR